MNLQEQLNQVRESLSQLDGNNRDHLADISRLKAQETELTNQIALEEAEQQRIQVQEEKVESISLPHNFNEIFEDPRANEIIIELIQQFQRQAYAEHNAELNEIFAAHRQELTASVEREQELKRKNDELQANWDERNRTVEILTSMLEEKKLELTEEQIEHEITLSTLNETKLEANDAQSKRDAAVAKAEGLELLLTEKQAQIDKLRDEIAIGAVAAVKVVDVSPTDRLAKLIEESKQAKVKSALDIALENNTPFRGKVTTGAVAELQTPEVQPFPEVNQTGNTISGLDTIYSFIVPAIDQTTVDSFRAQEGEVQAESNGLDQGDAEEAGKSVEERLAALEGKMNIVNNCIAVLAQRTGGLLTEDEMK